MQLIDRLVFGRLIHLSWQLNVAQLNAKKSFMNVSTSIHQCTAGNEVD